MKKDIFLFLLIALFAVQSAAQKQFERKISREQYIETYKNDAIRGMLENGIPASITLAQGILESGDGNSPLAVKANNHFGIKCHSDWTGKTFKQDDDAKNECFRKYKTVYESYKDHLDFLSKRSRYAFLFEYKTTDYKSWAHGLKKAGYATNPKYPVLLIKIIEENNLAQYDKAKKPEQLAKTAKKEKQKKDEEVIVAAKKTPTSSKTKNKPTSATKVRVSSNNIKYTRAKTGDSYQKIADNNEMGLWQILKYNDLNKIQKPKAGDIIYLQPKRAKSKVAAHRVKSGETPWAISQKYGVKMEEICKKNNITPSSKLSAGTILALK
jgi:LysM repeat protein